MIIDIHAGHNPANKVACGASDLLNESIENRIILEKLKNILTSQGHKVYDSTCNDGYSVGDIINKIVRSVNSHKDTELAVSLHFNAYKPQHHQDGHVMGCEVLHYDERTFKYGTQICKNLNAIGIPTHGQPNKIRRDLGFIRSTNPLAILIEICFVDDSDDYNRYKGHEDAVAQAIALGLQLKNYTSSNQSKPSTQATTSPSKPLDRPIIDDVKFVGNPTTCVAQMEAWAIANNAIEFAKIAKPCYDTCISMGLDPAPVYAQTALETGWLYKNGQSQAGINASYHNPCGLKVTSGGSDYDKNAHKVFKDWNEGFRAMGQHLLLYYGAEGYPLKNPVDPRHFNFLFGKAKTVVGLGGEGKWNNNPEYGKNIMKLYRKLLATEYKKPVETPIAPNIDTNNLTIVTYTNIADMPAAMLINTWLGYPVVNTNSFGFDRTRYANILHVGGAGAPSGSTVLAGRTKYDTLDVVVDYIKKNKK